MVFVLVPSILIFTTTVILDVFNHKMAAKNNWLDSDLGVILTEERKQREKIPKRATMINTCLLVSAIVYGGIITNRSEMTLETRVLLVTFSNALVTALRNPIIAQCAQKGGRAVVGIFHMIPTFDDIFFVETGHTREKAYFWNIHWIFNGFLADFSGIFGFFSNFILKI